MRLYKTVKTPPKIDTKTTELENEMKPSRLSALIALVLLLCFGLHTAGYAQTSPTTTSYTAVVSTPNGPSDPPAGPGYQYFGSTATLKPVGQPGELTASNLRYKWTAKMKQWQSGSFSDSNAPTDFLDASSPPKDTSTANPTTTLRTVFSSPGYYQLTLSVTITYDMVDSSGNGQTNLTASGSATCQIEVAVPDFSMKGGTSITVPLDSSTPITVTASPINNFYGTIQLGLTASNPNAGQQTNPSGVTLGSGSGDSSLSILLFGTQGNYPLTASDGSASTTTMVNVAGNATPAPNGTPFVVYGDGSDNGPSIEHSTTFNLTIPKRYAEITCPLYDPNPTNNSKLGPNTRSTSDGSIWVDAAAAWTIDPSNQFTGWHGRGSMKTRNEQGFASVKSYTWTPTYGGQGGTDPGITKGINVSSFLLDDYLTTSLQSGSALSKSSVINLTITNSPGSVPYSTSYKIAWHYPYENWQKVGSFFPDNPSYTLYPSTLTALMKAGGSLNLTLPNATFSASGAFTIASAATGTASAYVGANGPGLAAIGITGAGVPVEATLLAAASFLIQATTPTPEQAKPLPTDFTAFDQNVKIQEAIENHQTTYIGGPNNISMPIDDPASQRMSPAIADAASANHYAQEAYIYNYGNPMVNAEAGIHNSLQNWMGESYTSAGYAGQVSEQTKFQSTWFYVYNWTVNSTPPGPRG